MIMKGLDLETLSCWYLEQSFTVFQIMIENGMERGKNSPESFLSWQVPRNIPQQLANTKISCFANVYMYMYLLFLA